MTERRNLDTERFLAHYETMQRIRAFERAALRAAREGLATGAIHASIGQEAVASGICGNLSRSDLLLSNHRGHGHTLAKGAGPRRDDARAVRARRRGWCGGKGGSMHIADFGVGMLGANGVVGANILIAAGAAHGIKLRRSRAGDDRVVVCIFGDGAVNRGPFLEGLNWAAVYGLPVLFVCEDNGFAATTRTEALTAGPGPAARAESLGLVAGEVDGNDIVAVDRDRARFHRRRASGGTVLSAREDVAARRPYRGRPGGLSPGLGSRGPLGGGAGGPPARRSSKRRAWKHRGSERRAKRRSGKWRRCSRTPARRTGRRPPPPRSTTCSTP